MKYFSKKETKENILFFSLLFLVILFNIYHYRDNSSLINAIFLFLFCFSGLIYGFFSQNPLKSFIFGFLFWPLLIICFSLLENYTFTSFYTNSRFDIGTLYLVLISIWWGLPGYFMSKARMIENKNKKVIYSFFAIAFCLIGTTAFFIVSGMH